MSTDVSVNTTTVRVARAGNAEVAVLIAGGAVAAAARLVELNPGGRRSPASSASAR